MSRRHPADLFGHTRLRRLERQLIAEYRASVTGALAMLQLGTFGVVAQLAALPDIIRGYEQIKLDNMAR